MSVLGTFKRKGYSGILCRVCGDKSSGFHYGAFSCEGCKGFFRRSVISKKMYHACNKTYGCFVLKTNRNQCQFCRYKRCIEVGMSYKDVRLGKWLKNIPRTDSNSKMFSKDEKMNGDIQLTQYISCTVNEAFQKATESLDYFTLLYTKQKIVIENKADISCLYSRYLPGIVRFVTTFAKEIPVFNHLHKYVQLQLVKDGLIEIATIIDSLQLKLYYNNIFYNKLKICIPKDKLYLLGFFGTVVRLMHDVKSKLEKLNLTSIEIALLSAIVLFCPDREGIIEKTALVKVETELVLALKSEIDSRKGNTTIVFAKAVEILTDLRAISARYLEKLLSTRLDT